MNGPICASCCHILAVGTVCLGSGVREGVGSGGREEGGEGGREGVNRPYTTVQCYSGLCSIPETGSAPISRQMEPTGRKDYINIYYLYQLHYNSQVTGLVGVYSREGGSDGILPQVNQPERGVVTSGAE